MVGEMESKPRSALSESGASQQSGGFSGFIGDTVLEAGAFFSLVLVVVGFIVGHNVYSPLAWVLGSAGIVLCFYAMARKWSGRRRLVTGLGTLVLVVVVAGIAMMSA